MAWARLDDIFPEQPKLLGVPDADQKVLATIPVVLTAIQVRAICYSSRNLTDGIVPLGALPGILSGIDGEGWPDRMVQAGLWERCKPHTRPHMRKKSTGFIIHDYLDYNPSKKSRENMSQQRSNAAKSRWERYKDRMRGGMQSECKSDANSIRTTPRPDPHKRTPLTPPSGKKKRSRKKTTSDPNCTDCLRLIGLLNELTGKNYEGSGKALPMIHARHTEKGMLLCERVVRVKTWKWLGTDSEDFLRPETLFRPTKFDAYVNESMPRVPPPPEFDKFSGAGKEEMRRYKEKHSRISPERREAGISYVKHEISEVEKRISMAQEVPDSNFHGGKSGKADDLDALAKKLEDLRRELVFLEAGKGMGDE